MAENFKFNRLKYQEEINNLINNGSISQDLGVFLKALISAHINKTPPPEFNISNGKLVNEHLPNGIILVEVLSVGSVMPKPNRNIEEEDGCMCYQLK